jgi:hydrogenase maturation protease
MRPLVIGVGNRWRADDGLGPAVIDALEAGVVDGVDLLKLDGEPARLVMAWEGRELVVVIDAVRTGACPGTVHVLDPLDRELVSPPSPSTHGAGVASAVALGRALDRLPGHLLVLGVEPERLDHGDELSPPVAAAFDEVVRLVREEVASPCA